MSFEYAFSALKLSLRLFVCNDIMIQASATNILPKSSLPYEFSTHPSLSPLPVYWTIRRSGPRNLINILLHKTRAVENCHPTRWRQVAIVTCSVSQENCLRRTWVHFQFLSAQRFRYFNGLYRPRQIGLWLFTCQIFRISKLQFATSQAYRGGTRYSYSKSPTYKLFRGMFLRTSRVFLGRHRTFKKLGNLSILI